MLRHLSFKDTSFEPKLTDDFQENTDSITLDKDYTIKEVPTSDTSTSKKEKIVKRLSLNTFTLKGFQKSE